MNCVRCGRVLPPDAKECPYCGEPVLLRKRRRSSDAPAINRPAYQRRTGNGEEQKASKEVPAGAASMLGIPKELRHDPESGRKIRVVRHSPTRESVRIDALPVEKKPAIYKNSHKKK